MKKIILMTLLSTLALNPLSSYAENTAGTYTAKAPVSLDYYAFGWNHNNKWESNSCNDIGAKLTLYTVGTLFTLGAVPVLYTFSCLDSNDKKTGIFNTEFSLIVTENSNDRIALNISSEKKKGCIGFTLSLIGEGDGFGGYDLYQSKEDYIAGKTIGRLMNVAEEVLVDIEPGKTFTKGKNGNLCSWNLDDGLHLKMSAQNN